VPPNPVTAAAVTKVRPRPLAVALPLLLMAAGALETPAPWNLLWIGVPTLGAAGYLANLHRWRLGWLAPAAAAGWMLSLPQSHSVEGWFLVGAVASATLFGLARREGVSGGRGLWSLLPLLGLALAFPLSSLYAPALRSAAAGVESFGEEAYKSYESLGLEGGSLGELAAQIHQATASFAWVVRHTLPSLLFAWAASLVALSTLLARRGARAVGKPVAPGGGFASFRMPEGAVWLLLLGLGFIALRQPMLLPAGVNLAVCLGLGYCLQGIAVLDFAMLARGFSSGMIWILFVFVTFFALPVLLVTSTGLGVADIWLDLRRRAQGPGGEKHEV
jgi:hypothetical protein